MDEETLCMVCEKRIPARHTKMCARKLHRDCEYTWEVAVKFYDRMHSEESAWNSITVPDAPPLAERSRRTQRRYLELAKVAIEITKEMCEGCFE